MSRKRTCAISSSISLLTSVGIGTNCRREPLTPPYQSLGATGRQFQFKKRTQPFIRTHNQTFSVCPFRAPAVSAKRRLRVRHCPTNIYRRLCSTNSRGLCKSCVDYVTRRFNASSARLKRFRGAAASMRQR